MFFQETLIKPISITITGITINIFIIAPVVITIIIMIVILTTENATCTDHADVSLNSRRAVIE